MTNRQVESLLEHQSFLSALARSMLGNDVEADDIVQETWLVALRSAKRPDEVRRSWLAGIVRNLVRRRRRDGQRRHRRERIAARACVVGATDDACAERSLRRRIAELVVELPERYREPLLLRYYDGLTPRAIATRLGLPGSTVRTRIQRGLARVRVRLEVGNGNGRSLSLLLAAVATERPARRLTPLALRVACVTGAAAVGLLLARGAPEARPRSWEEARAPAPERATHAPAHGTGAVASVPAEVEAGEPVVAVPLLLEGTVHPPAGAVARTVRLEVTAAGAAAARHACVEGGAPFALDVARLAEGATALHVRATHPEAEPAERIVAVRRDAHTGGARVDRLDLCLRRCLLVPEQKLAPEWLGAAESLAAPAGARSTDARASHGGAPAEEAGVALEGVVRLPPGTAPAPVVLDLWRPGGAALRASVRGGTRFAIPVAELVAEPRPESLRLRASHVDAMPDERDVPVLFDPDTGDVVLPFVAIELQPAAYLEGTVELEGHGPVADATVVLFDYESDAPGGEVIVAAANGPDGRYRLPVMPDRRYYVAAAAPGYAPAGVAAAAEWGPEVAPLLLRRGVAISGHVRQGDEPGAGAVVSAAVPDGDGRTLPLGHEDRVLAWSAGGIAWRHAAAEADAEGAFEIAGLEARVYTVALEALVGGGTPWTGTREALAPATVDFDLPVAKLKILVMGGGGPLARASVVAIRGDRRSPAQLTDEKGAAAVMTRPGETLRLAVSAAGFVPQERGVTTPAEGVLDVLFELEEETNLATLAVTLRSAGGLALPAKCSFELLPLDGRRPLRRTAAVEDGKFFLRELEPGGYDVLALPGGPASAFLPAAGRVQLTRGATAALALEVRAGGRIAVRIVGEGLLPGLWLEGATDAGMWPQDLGPDGVGTYEWSFAGDTFVSGLLAPGTYVLHVLAPAGARSFPIEVRAGETAKITVPTSR